MAYLKKPPNMDVNKLKPVKKRGRKLNNVKMGKISQFKTKVNSRKDSIKDLNRSYSRLLADHKTNSKELVEELLRLIGDQYRLHIRQKHSTRILQACLKYGTDEQREYIYHKIKEEIPHLCTSNHGSHLAIKAYRYCNMEARKHFEASIINSSSSVGYVKSRYGSMIWDFIYNRFSCSRQISSLLHLLLPNSIRILRPELHESLVKVKNLNQLYERIIVEEELKSKFKEICINLFGKLIDKSLTNTSISHDIGYLACLLSNEDEKYDFAERFSQGLDSLYLTKSGVYIASYLYGYTTPKGRKIIVKQLKQNLEEMCTNAVTNLFVSRVLLLTDDTKLTIEHLVKPLGGLINKLSFDRYGHKIITSISNNDALTLYNGYERQVIQLPSPKSLKEFSLRHSQLCEAFRPLLLTELSQNYKNLDIWLTDKYSSLVIESALSKFNYDLFKAIITSIECKFDDTLGLLNNSICLHLIQRIVKRMPKEFKESGCAAIWDVIKPRLKLVLVSRSVFLLVAILEGLEGSSPILAGARAQISKDDISRAKTDVSHNCGLEILERILFSIN